MDIRRRISFNMNTGDPSSSIDTSNYMTILALEDGLTAKLSTNACQYCVDGDGNWIDLPADTTTQSINQGQTLSFKGNLTPNSSKGIGTFTISKKCNLEGNCMSLLFGNDAVNNKSVKSYAFYNLFENCTTIIQVSDRFLPATTISNKCYYYMFYGCTSLTTAPELPAISLYEQCYSSMFYGCNSLTTSPELPATTLAYRCYSSMFRGCTSLTTAPELPATTLSNGCYNSMFYQCNSLTTAPELPATTLSEYCYYSMFLGCTSLTTAPELPATTLADGCYKSMFYGCKSLTIAPELPATILDVYCYSGMFQSCTSLTTAPELPATTLSNGCYNSMFYQCNSLTTAPELPATTLSSSCYESMFYLCTSLTTAPELPATTLSGYCYRYMFNFCSKLNHIKMLATNISASSCLTNWVYGVSSTGTFVKNPAMTSLPTGGSGIPSGWTVYNDGEEPINTDNYMTILALENGLTASLSTNACQYCIDGDGNWIDLPAGTTTQSINSGQTLSFRGNLTPSSSSGIGTFTINKKCNLEGNCMSLLFGDDAVNNNSLSGKDYAFYRLFYNCTTIIQVSETFLPATTLATDCYNSMFYGCSKLTIAPELPATTLSNYCYSNMFRGCTSLTTAPELPATTLANGCYSNMFSNCTSLTSAPELPATTLAYSCYYSMFQDCSSLTQAPELPATTLANYCYQYMFSRCTSLTSAPSILPATTLANSCYYYMFYGCSSLTTAPELPATTLFDSCYRSMFQGCKNLNYIKMLATDISASNCLKYWVSNVSSTGTFVKNPAMTSLPTGTSGIPNGWTVVDAD